MAQKYQYFITPIHPLLQVFGQHQLRAAAFMYVIDFVKRIANEKQTKSTWLDHIMRAALHFMGKDLFAVVAQSHAHAFAQSLHSQ